MVSAWNKLLVFALTINVKWAIFKLEYQLGYYPLCKRASCLMPWVIIVLVISSYL